MVDLASFVREYPVVRFAKGQTILSAGESAEYMLVISAGFAKILATDTQGTEQMLWIAGRLDVVPTEQFFRKKATAMFSYAALSDMTAYKVPKADFLAFAGDSPVVMQEIARGMSGHYDDLLYRLSSITQVSAREKLLHTLKNITERFSASTVVNFAEIGLDITHQDVAGLIHANRETVSIELKKLRDEGVVFYDRTSFVVYADKLDKIIE